MFDLVHLAQTAGHLGLFTIIFLESGILFGLIFPGDSLLFTAGFLASQGYFRIEVLLPLFFLAAFAGDSVGYWIGKSVGPRIFTREKSFWFKPENVEKARDFFERHGTKTIVLARFMPVIRTLIPIMAGVGEMKYETFLLYNALGAAIWALGLTSLGYFFGNSIPNADHYILPVIGLIVLISLLPAVWEFYRGRKRG